MYIVIAGGGIVGGTLARELIENNHDVVIIEPNKAVCDKLYSATGVVAINGSASRMEVLNEANISKADVVVAATGNDADNLPCAILAKSCDVPRIIVRMRNPSYENAYKVAGVDKIIRVTDILVEQIMTNIEKPSVEKIASLGDGKSDLCKIIIPKNARISGKSISEITKDRKFPSKCIFIALYDREQDEFHIPRGRSIVGENYEIFFISPQKYVMKAVNYLTITK